MIASDAGPVDPASLARNLPGLQRELPGLPGDDAGPVFKSPWEAHAFALALTLHERGTFTWKEWAQALSEVIADVRRRGEPDTGEDYYRHWLTALERMVAQKGIVTEALLQQRRRQWDEAARRTPHGQPIAL